MSGPWDADIDTILNDHAPVAAEPPTTRELMMMAWQYGYTTGLAHDAKIKARFYPDVEEDELVLIDLDDEHAQGQS